jgi:lysophospholipase L1-like esterase
LTRTIVCFGDSNTWGYVPGSALERFPREVRWPGRLATMLGDGFEVIAEGLNGRTASIERPDSEGRNGLPYLLPCLHSHAPIELVVIFLGTNDVNFVDDDRVAWCVARLVRVVRTSEAGPGYGTPEVLVVCPPPFAGHRLGPSFAEVCAELECELLDLDGIASYSDLDGEHLDEAGQAALATAVEERVRRLLA